MTRREKAASIRATKKCLSKCQQINDFVNPFFELNNYIMHGLHICCSDKVAKYCARAALNCCSAVIDLEQACKHTARGPRFVRPAKAFRECSLCGPRKHNIVNQQLNSVLCIPRAVCHRKHFNWICCSHHAF